MESMSHTGPALGEHPLPLHPQSWRGGFALSRSEKKENAAELCIQKSFCPEQ